MVSNTSSTWTMTEGLCTIWCCLVIGMLLAWNPTAHSAPNSLLLRCNKSLQTHEGVAFTSSSTQQVSWEFKVPGTHVWSAYPSAIQSQLEGRYQSGDSRYIGVRGDPNCSTRIEYQFDPPVEINLISGQRRPIQRRLISELAIAPIEQNLQCSLCSTGFSDAQIAAMFEACMGAHLYHADCLAALGEPNSPCIGCISADVDSLRNTNRTYSQYAHGDLEAGTHPQALHHWLFRKEERSEDESKNRADKAESDEKEEKRAAPVHPSSLFRQHLRALNAASEESAGQIGVSRYEETGKDRAAIFFSLATLECGLLRALNVRTQDQLLVEVHFKDGYGNPDHPPTFRLDAPNAILRMLLQRPIQRHIEHHADYLIATPRQMPPSALADAGDTAIHERGEHRLSSAFLEDLVHLVHHQISQAARCCCVCQNGLPSATMAGSICGSQKCFDALVEEELPADALHQIKHSPEATNLLLAMAYTSAQVVDERQLVFADFPRDFEQLDPKTGQLQRDYAEVARAIASIGDLLGYQSITSEKELEEFLGRKNSKAYSLLSWVLKSSRNFLRSVDSLGISVRRDFHLAGIEIICTFELLSPPADRIEAFNTLKLRYGSKLHFHGTSGKRLHSILRNGLRSQSDTALKTHGAVWGRGVYLTTHVATAYSYGSDAPWRPGSILPKTSRVLLIVEVAKAPDTQQALHSIVVKNPDSLMIRYVTFVQLT